MYGELMSRIGKKPVIILDGVKVEQKGQTIEVSGPLGSLQLECHPQIKVKIDSAAGQVLVENDHLEVRQNKQMHGTTRALIANMVAGVSKGYEKKLDDIRHRI